MLQPPEEGAPIQVAPGVKLIGATRNPHVLRALIAEGKFGEKLGRSLLALVPEPHAGPMPIANHEFRLLHGDGHWYAVCSIAQQGIHALRLKVGLLRSGCANIDGQLTKKGSCRFCPAHW